ncbi:toxin glutamine deamidase domain-containing protein [Microtetraspora sp. AC03309]|uniref:toxin glutamine deamidase domain-containing protein n=1 Tax=Microtetraspora sp. AC03309 TaxID=2779376 RepID=UPI001E4965EB|nr:toxin glutamine deamidase domain-containing protein [Microtetraspora sp. AC03309]
MSQEMTHRQSHWQTRGLSRWRLPTGVYNPVVTPDGRRWRDYEKAAEVPAPSLDDRPLRIRVPVAAAGGPDWFDRPGRPPRLDLARPYGMPGGLAEPDPRTQRDLDQAVHGRFPDPRGTWIRLINAEGPSEDPFRSTNAVDCALSVLSTWHGEPVVAAPRLPEFDESGTPVLTGETKGVSRAERWIGHRFEYVGHGRRAYTVIGGRLLSGGHGAAAILITRWPSGGSHAWNAVNCHGEILWIDAQRGHMAVEPPYADVTGVFCVIIDHEGQRL